MRTAQDNISKSRKQLRRERNDPNNLHYNQKKVDNPVLSKEVAEKLKPSAPAPAKWVPEYK